MMGEGMGGAGSNHKKHRQLQHCERTMLWFDPFHVSRLLVHAALSTMEADRGADTYMLAWNAFPDETFKQQFLMYLQWIDGLKVDPGKSEKEKKQSQEAYFKILAHISLGCALALSRCVKEVPVIKPQQLPP